MVIAPDRDVARDRPAEGIMVFLEGRTKEQPDPKPSFMQHPNQVSGFSVENWNFTPLNVGTANSSLSPWMLSILHGDRERAHGPLFDATQQADAIGV